MANDYNGALKEVGITINRKPEDKRVVYGARCVWWDSIHSVGTNVAGLPCCPKCRGVLFEVDSMDTWFSNVDRFEKDNHPGYRKFIEWLKGKCFRRFPEALEAYKKETGIEVKV